MNAAEHYAAAQRLLAMSRDPEARDVAVDDRGRRTTGAARGETRHMWIRQAEAHLQAAQLAFAVERWSPLSLGPLTTKDEWAEAMEWQPAAS